MQLLIVGSLDGQVGGASRIAVARGAAVSHVDDVERALAHLRAGRSADLVMIDVRSDVAGLVGRLASERIDVPVVACGTATDTAAAVAAIKAGAKEYVPLPPDAELIAAILAAVTEDDHAIVHRDPRMADVLKLAEQVAGSSASVLITGPSGTGKELVARHIHQKSPRAARRFVAVNCAAIPETLLESELFGYEKGAFTGAVARRLGKFEEASGGTLLLDEISEMDPRLQAKLLRAVQEGEIDRLGGGRPIKVDVRILATSNRNLADTVARGGFREDLYFRLSVVNVALPALKERPGDIEPLAEHFLQKFTKANGTPPRPLSAAARAKLKAHPWPGNVRELENTIHRAVLIASGGEIGPEAVLLTPTPAAASAPGAAPEGSAAAPGEEWVGRSVADVERHLIIDTLKHCLGNRTHAATILGISIRTLRNKLRQYATEGHPVPPPGEAAA